MNMQHETFDSFGKLLYLRSERSHPGFTKKSTNSPLFGCLVEGEEQPLSSHSAAHPATVRGAPRTPPSRPHLLVGGRVSDN